MRAHARLSICLSPVRLVPKSHELTQNISIPYLHCLVHNRLAQLLVNHVVFVLDIKSYLFHVLYQNICNVCANSQVCVIRIKKCHQCSINHGFHMYGS